ncbi:MAG: alpha/beta hydrolase-fold protein [Acidobacteriota bacterium]
MFRKGSLLLVACAIVTVACTAGAPGTSEPGVANTSGSSSAGDGTPAGPPSYKSPEVAADRAVTFRYFAPNAHAVSVSGELDNMTASLVKGVDGVWAATVGPLPPDIYTYAFNVDGVTALDPKNTNTKLGYAAFGPVSVVQVPGDGPAFYDAKPVPHGEVRIRPYESKALGVGRTIWVYTPPGYDAGKDFPVLYLLHGAGDVESGWTLIGRANLILDNLIADGMAKPMVIVMPLGHTVESFWTGPAKAVASPVSNALAGAPLDQTIVAMMSGDGSGGLGGFARDLLDDVIPLVERTYKVSRRADDRAIAGLSMGGGQAINITFNKPEMFRYVGLMSPAASGKVTELYAKALGNPQALNTQFKVFWMSVGNDDGVTGPGDKEFDAALTAKGVTHTFKVVEGRHEWTIWRKHLREFATLLFR